MKIGDKVESKIVKFVGTEPLIGTISNIIKTKTEPFIIYFVNWGNNKHTMHTNNTIKLLGSKKFKSIW